MANSKPNPLSFALLSVESHNQQTGDKDLERAFQSLSLKQRLAAIQTAVGSDDAKLAFLPGAGAVYMAGCKYAVVEDRWMAIFTGEIENYSYLVKKYCLAEAGLDPQGQYLLETVRALSPLNDAQVVALLFKKLGPTFMSKLRGTFTFAVYDSNVGRVLAANDCNGSGSLWQGHVDDCLVVACNMEVPTIQVVERTAISAGEYKFGWRATPIAYMASQQAVQSRCNEAMQAAMAALASASGPLPSSTSSPIPTPSAPVPALNRRYSKTMPRNSLQGPSRISLSAGASSVSSTGPWHTPGNVPPSPSSSFGGGGSYVPPHRRSQQFGPSQAPYAPSAGKRGLSRNSTSSASGTWRRSTSDATCRPPPKMSFRAPSTTTLRRPSAPGMRPSAAEKEEEPAAIKTGTSVPANGGVLHDALLLAGDDDEEDYVATTMDSWRLAASSMLFQPAKVSTRSQATPSGADPSQPVEEPEVDDTDMMETDTFLSCRSNPIPIRHSRDSRPSVDHPTGEHAVGSTLAGDGPILVEKKEIQSSLESVLCSSNSSATAQPRTTCLEKPSSMTFPWCESESSFGNGLAHEHGRLDVKPTLPEIEVGSDVSLNGNTYDAGTLHQHNSPVFMPAASSPECLEAKRLLDLATQWADGVDTSQPSPSKNGCTSDSMGAATPQRMPSVTGASVPHAQRPAAEDVSTAPAPSAVQTKPAPTMTSSGSFSDALALLLRARSSKTGAPGSPTEVAPRSGLSVSTLATAFVSNEASQEVVYDEPAEPKVPQGALDSSKKLPELGDPLRSVNAGVAWQFGDRIIPSDLLQELAGGKDALAEEQAALASLVYSSPCAVCIVDVRDKNHPVVHVNLLFERQTGYTAEEVLGHNCRFLQIKPGAKRSPSVTSIAIHRAVESGRSYCGKILNYHKDGTALWNQLSLVPVRCTKSLIVTHYIGMQSFTKAEPHVAAATAQPAALMRGSSHQCLISLDNELGSMKMGKKSNSHMQLSALNLEIASTASFPVCGARSVLMS